MAILSPSPKLQFFDANGNPLVGGKLYTYAAGTTTPLATYTDSTGGTANTNPIILDSRGEANVWLASGTAYKFALQSAASVAIWTVDNIDATLGTMASQNANNVAITGGSITGLTTFTTTNGATIQGLTVGKGAGAVSTNTAVGLSALVLNTTGASNTAVGRVALNANTTGSSNSALGNSSLVSATTGGDNTGIGNVAGASITTGNYNTVVGSGAASQNNFSNVAALGYQALYNNSASNNTAVGYQAGYSNTTGTELVAIGRGALYANTTGNSSTAVGRLSLTANTTGSDNAALGNATLNANTTGSYNTALGSQALISNTTASNNTAVGYQAAYSQNGSLCVENVYVGYQCGYSSTSGNRNTFVGNTAGYYNTTGTYNTFIGKSAGESVTTGSKNTIIGGYIGNQGGLDIRTASNYIVLSDGDGNPRGIFDSSGRLLVGTTSASIGTNLEVVNTGGAATAFVTSQVGDYTVYSHNKATSGNNSFIIFGTEAAFTTRGSITYNRGGGLTAYNVTSDYRAKTVNGPVENALNKVIALKPSTGRMNDAEFDIDFFVAHELQEVVPSAVTGEKDAVNEDGTPNYQMVDKSALIPLLTAAIQEQQVIIQQLQADVAALKGQA